MGFLLFVYDDHDLKVWQGDALELLRAQSDGSVDLVLADPPYNIGKDFGNSSDCLSLESFLQVTRERLAEVKRVLTPTGSVVWFASHRWVGYLQVMLYDLGFFYRRMIIWRYENGMSRQVHEPVTEYEPILWFSRSPDTWTYNLDLLRLPYKSTERIKTPVFKRRKDGSMSTWAPDPRGKKRGDVWNVPVLAGQRFSSERVDHPTQKPVVLIIDLLRALLPLEGERLSGTVLDPFLGSGTSLVGVAQLNAQGHHIYGVGAELSVDYVQRLVIPRLKAMLDKTRSSIYTGDEFYEQTSF